MATWMWTATTNGGGGGGCYSDITYVTYLHIQTKQSSELPSNTVIIIIISSCIHYNFPQKNGLLCKKSNEKPFRSWATLFAVAACRRRRLLIGLNGHFSTLRPCHIRHKWRQRRRKKLWNGRGKDTCDDDGIQCPHVSFYLLVGKWWKSTAECHITPQI